ncbi:MAG: hypothetical protein ACRC10_00505 [Thermoguttaceae bacterium]
MSTFKKMQIPRQIAFPPKQLRIEAKQIEVTLCKIVARRKLSDNDFLRLDDFVSGICKRHGSALNDDGLGDKFVQ